MSAGNEQPLDESRRWLAPLGSQLCMSCRVHATHKSSGFQFLCDYSDWAVAVHDIPRLTQAGFVGISANGSAPAVREPGSRQREAQLLDVLQHLQVQCEQAAAREGRLLQLLEAMQRQQQVCVEREARLLALVEQVQRQRVPNTVHQRSHHRQPQPAAGPSPGPAASEPPASIPQRSEAVLTYLAEHPGPQAPATVQRGLGWGQEIRVRDILRRLRQRGLVQGEGGRYQRVTPERGRQSCRA